MTATEVRVADGVELPVDVVAMLDAIDGLVADVTAPTGPGGGSMARGAALVVADYARRRLAAATARIIAAADRDGDFHDDGHRQLRPWVNARLNTSRADALADVRLAELGRDHPLVLVLLEGGAISVSHARLLATTYANPRVRDAFGEALASLCDLATSVPYDVFATHVHTWIQLADADGSRPDPHDQRRAHAATVGEMTFLEAALPGLAGAEVAEILERFSQHEFVADWERAKAVHGDDVCAALLARTATQRRADALVAIFRRAVAAPPGATAPEPVVNIVIDRATFEAQLAAMVDDRPADFDTTNPARSWCATTGGATIPPAEAVAAAIVGHVRRVVIDRSGTVIGFGRKRRIFTGSSRAAAAVQFFIQTAGRCSWPGCGRHRTQIDHTHPHRDGGRTDLDNAGPLCPFHNLLKNAGYTTWRDAHGRWHTHRPNGTPITPA